MRISHCLTNLFNCNVPVAMILFLFWQQAYSVEIINVRSGLACVSGKNAGNICHETEDIYVTGQGQCMYNQKDENCTWHGYSIYYKNAEEGDRLQCSYINTDYKEEGDDFEIIEERDIDGTFEIVLDTGFTEYFETGFSVLAVFPAHRATYSQTTICRFKDLEVFRVTWNFIYPTEDSLAGGLQQLH